MKIQLEAKTDKLSFTIEICANNPMTIALFNDPRFSLKKRLNAVAVGLRSDLLMFVIDVEKEVDIK